MEAKAVAKYVRMSPIKLQPVCDLVRGKDVKEALGILKFTPNHAARDVEKVVKSAVANATHNNQMNEDKLYIKECFANEKSRECGQVVRGCMVPWWHGE